MNYALLFFPDCLAFSRHPSSEHLPPTDQREKSNPPKNHSLITDTCELQPLHHHHIYHHHMHHHHYHYNHHLHVGSPKLLKNLQCCPSTAIPSSELPTITTPGITNGSSGFLTHSHHSMITNHEICKFATTSPLRSQPKSKLLGFNLNSRSSRRSSLLGESSVQTTRLDLQQLPPKSAATMTNNCIAAVCVNSSATNADEPSSLITCSSELIESTDIPLTRTHGRTTSANDLPPQVNCRPDGGGMQRNCGRSAAQVRRNSSQIKKVCQERNDDQTVKQVRKVTLKLIVHLILFSFKMFRLYFKFLR